MCFIIICLALGYIYCFPQKGFIKVSKRDAFFLDNYSFPTLQMPTENTEESLVGATNIGDNVDDSTMRVLGSLDEVSSETNNNDNNSDHEDVSLEDILRM